MKPVFAMAIAALLAGCVQPAYMPLQPIELQPYPPPVPYQSGPAYRPPLPPPAAPVYPEPAPLPLLDGPAGAAPTMSPPTSDDSGAIPLQEMPAPVPDSSTPSSSANPSSGNSSTANSGAQPTPMVQRPPTSGPGSNIPLEGFRPMRGQTRPAP